MLSVAVVVVAGCSPPADERARPAAPSPVPTVPPLPFADRTPDDPVYVFLLLEDGDGYDLDDYDPLPRPSRGARRAGTRLQVALDHLVRGTTRKERRNGYTSAFSRDTAEVLSRVELRGHRAVVDFRDFRRGQGQWGTSYGGSVFLIQLPETIFQFGSVQSILFRIERSCDRFWTFLQAGGCEIVHRRVEGRS